MVREPPSPQAPAAGAAIGDRECGAVDAARGHEESTASLPELVHERLGRLERRLEFWGERLHGALSGALSDIAAERSAVRLRQAPQVVPEARFGEAPRPISGEGPSLTASGPLAGPLVSWRSPAPYSTSPPPFRGSVAASGAASSRLRNSDFSYVDCMRTAFPPEPDASDELRKLGMNNGSSSVRSVNLVANSYASRNRCTLWAPSPDVHGGRPGRDTIVEAASKLPRAAVRHSVRQTRNLKGMHKDDLRNRYNKLVGQSYSTLPKTPNMAEVCVRSPAFDYLISFVVAYNVVLIGAQVEYEAETLSKHPLFFYSEVICVIVFTWEVIMRLMAFGRNFFSTGGYLWATLDVFLLVIAYTDFILMSTVDASETGSGKKKSSSGANVGKIIKVVRMARIMRVIRMFRFLGQLRIMFGMVMNSLNSLFWLIVLLLLVLYVFAVVLTKGVYDYLHPSNEDSPDVHADILKENFGGLFITMYTLFKSMTGGLDWGTITDALLTVSPVYFTMFVLFICFTIFSVLNIITGVFVDGAIELAKRDRFILVEKENRAREATAEHLLELFELMDSAGEGVITREQFAVAMQNHEIVCFIEALQVDTSESMQLFEMLDSNGDDCVDVAEWVDGMRRFKGGAMSVDIYKLRSEVHRLTTCLSSLRLSADKQHNDPDKGRASGFAKINETVWQSASSEDRLQPTHNRIFLSEDPTRALAADSHGPPLYKTVCVVQEQNGTNHMERQWSR